MEQNLKELMRPVLNMQFYRQNDLSEAGSVSLFDLKLNQDP